MRKNIFLGLLLLAVASCKKDDTKPSDNNDNNNRLLYVVQDNLFNFSFYNTALTVTNLNSVLLDKGPYTVIIPDNNAFMSSGYNSSTDVAQLSGATLNNMVKYSILNGYWELNKLPFRFNQPITTYSGASIFVTHWVKNQDTVLTINGTPVTAENQVASNGLIQVVNAVMTPLTANKLSDAIAADPSLSYFNVALQLSGMQDLLTGDDAYTVFAPNNQAFTAAGFPSLDSVAQTDPAVLKDFVQYHIVAGRHFVYDYALSTDQTNVTQQTMLNNTNTTVNVQFNGVTSVNITLQGPGNTSAVALAKPNVLANNGVLHILNGVLKENF
jgi:uncharacterized surface protein with fasciclin (FAS1) repeats